MVLALIASCLALSMHKLIITTELSMHHLSKHYVEGTYIKTSNDDVGGTTNKNGGK